MSAFYRIGEIARPHGVHGAVRVNPTTDDARRFRGLSEAYLELRGEHIPAQIRVHSVSESSVILSIDGYETPEQANLLRGAYLSVDKAHAVSLPPDTYFVTDLIGCRVTDTEGASYGTLTDVFETGANDVYEIAHGRLMVPALKKVLSSVDVENKEIILDAEVLREVGLFAD